MSLYPRNEGIRVENYLRSTGFSTLEKIAATDTIRRLLAETVVVFRVRGEDNLPIQLIISIPEQEITWNWLLLCQEIIYKGGELRRNLKVAERRNKHSLSHAVEEVEEREVVKEN